jgi:lipopolysaccharide transport system permease protein
MLLFLSPVLYPVGAVPEVLRPLYRYNPLGIVIDATRAAVTGRPIDWTIWLLALGFCTGILVLGFSFFQRVQEEFADVL